MESNDTVYLLKECDAGTKMAVSAIDEVLDKASNQKMKLLLTESKESHTEIGNQLHRLLSELGSDGKEPNIMAKGMSWMKTNFKLGMDENDTVVADLITDGCNMGVKSLCRYQNQYKAADQKAKELCERLIVIEETLVRDLRPFL